MNGPQQRRSPRVDRRIPVHVLGVQPDGRRVDEQGEADQVSAHGVRMTIATALPTGCVVEIQNPESHRGARYRVVWVIEASRQGQWQMGLELVSGDTSFWGIEFPPADV